MNTLAAQGAGTHGERAAVPGRPVAFLLSYVRARRWQFAALALLVVSVTFRILHGSRDLALALVGTAQEFGVITEMLCVIGERHGLEDHPQAKPVPPRQGSIEFRGVGFSYPDGPKVFEDFNLVISAGQKIGLAGPSGGGKSTLLSLIQRMDDPQKGAIRIDGRPIKEVAQDSLRAGIAVVPQDVSLFRRTVMENIRYGRPDVTDEEVYAAARSAHCDEFIRRLPDGYRLFSSLWRIQAGDAVVNG